MGNLPLRLGVDPLGADSLGVSLFRRTSAGLLARDSFAADSIAQYTQSAGSSWSVSAGVLNKTTATGSIRRNSLTTCRCVTAKLLYSAGSNHGIGLMQPAENGGFYDGYQAQHYSDGKAYFYRIQGGVATSLGNTPWAQGTVKLHRLYTTGSQVTYRGGQTTLAQMVLTAADSVWAGSSGGVWGASSVAETYDDLDLRTAHTIVCTGLPTGWKLRVSDGVTTATAAESGGTATVDAGLVLFPLSAVTVLNAADVAQSAITNSTLLDMGGGDVYEYGRSAYFFHNFVLGRAA